MKKRLYLEISLQHKEEVEKAKKYNEENDYKYIIVDNNNLIEYDNLVRFLRFGYTMNIYADRVELRHKNYRYEEEDI